MSRFLTFVSALVILAAVSVTTLLQMIRRVDLPPHLLGHPLFYDSHFLTKEMGIALLEHAKKLADFPSNINDLAFYSTLREHVGEAVEMSQTGVCSHPFLVPSFNRTSCVLSGRVDVGRHFVLTGGAEGIKDKYETMIARVQSFGNYIFRPEDSPLLTSLFQDPKFQQFAKAVCPADRQVLDPFQTNFILQVPGQTVALHLDAPYFFGATRFQFPQWLLVAMVFSNLWASDFIDQVQVVSYIHPWTDTDEKRNGNFLYWDRNAPFKSQKGDSLAGSAVDGSKTVHAASVYRNKEKPPLMDKSARNVLSFVSKDRWELRSNGKVVRDYSTDDLRISVVYRARCFGSAQEMHRFKSLPDTELFSLESILDRFKNDLVQRQLLQPGEYDSPDGRLRLALKIMDVYIAYPMSDAAIPYNYCALPRLLPWTAPLLNLFC